MLVESFGHYDVTLLTLRGRGTSCCWLNTQGVTGFKFFFLCINDLGVSTFKICWGKRLDLISLLKRSAKSSQRASVGVLEDLLKLRITLKVVVKRDFQTQSWKEYRFQTYTSINMNKKYANGLPVVNKHNRHHILLCSAFENISRQKTFSWKSLVKLVRICCKIQKPNT